MCCPHFHLTIQAPGGTHEHISFSCNCWLAVAPHWAKSSVCTAPLSTACSQPSARKRLAGKKIHINRGNKGVLKNVGGNKVSFYVITVCVHVCMCATTCRLGSLDNLEAISFLLLSWCLKGSNSDHWTQWQAFDQLSHLSYPRGTLKIHSLLTPAPYAQWRDVYYFSPLSCPSSRQLMSHNCLLLFSNHYSGHTSQSSMHSISFYYKGIAFRTTFLVILGNLILCVLNTFTPV